MTLFRIAKNSSLFHSLLFILFCLGLNTAKAQVWEHQPKINFYSEVFLPVGNDTIYTVGEQHFKFSYDAGNSWDSTYLIPDFNADKLEQTADGAILIWGGYAQPILLKSNDRGMTWSTIVNGKAYGSPFPVFPFLCGHFADSLHGMIALDDSVFYTANGGASFTFRGLLTNPVAFNFIDNYWVTFGWYKDLSTSQDSGKSWHTRALPQLGNTNFYQQVSDSNTVYFADYSDLFKYNFATSAWDHVNAGLPLGNIQDFMAISDDTILILDESRIYRSTDGGTSFIQEQMSPAASSDLLQIRETRNTYFIGGPVQLYRFDPTQPIGIAERNWVSGKITLWPNPSTDNINFSLPITSFEIYDHSGRLIEQGSHDQVQSISIDQLKSGVYFIRIFTANGTSVLHFVKSQ